MHGKRRAEEGKEYEMKVVSKVLSRIDTPSFVVGLVVGCFLVSLTYTLTPKSHGMLDFPFLESQPSSSPSIGSGRVADYSVAPVLQNITKDTTEMERTSHSCELNSSRCITADDGDINKNSSTIVQPVQRPVTSDNKHKDVEPHMTKPLCDASNRRSDVCDIEGDVRVIGKEASLVLLVTPPPASGDSAKLEPWVIKPYPRKSDHTAMANVREVNVKPSYGYGQEHPRCSINHTVPAVVFSIAGYTGNYFHDFTDVLVPLFQTTRRYDGQVQLLVTNYKEWWIMKYQSYFKKITSYEIIDYDNDDRVHCFGHVTVGLNSDRDMVIEPSASPMGHSMVDFAKFMRDAYALERDRVMRPSADRPGRRPRLLLIARGRTRKFMNLDEIVRAAQKVGFEVVVAEAKFGGVAEFARVVNSCDIIMGVHGAGLTNFVFLPVGAVLIQVVPFGGLDWIAENYFREPAKRMKLEYLEYSISVAESTLTELYPRNDTVFTDPKSIHRLGWTQMEAIYLHKQNVKLDVKRFRPVLKKAFRILGQNVA